MIDSLSVCAVRFLLFGGCSTFNLPVPWFVELLLPPLAFLFVLVTCFALLAVLLGCFRVKEMMERGNFGFWWRELFRHQTWSLPSICFFLLLWPCCLLGCINNCHSKDRKVELATEHKEPITSLSV